ncbi:hypothetical protein OS493_038355 [Desmophyllum pertusum]|uniref:Uncharacterized protein n=1 Tax=Desmophyllum pertusum TaxID=174260 RepID=A0A9W9Y763_9CNID|nr:hypothetical protein OS493_038355 [Desmophyllum pertusum]
MSGDGDMLRLSARSRNSRSHSLKPQSQPMMLFKQRSKRTMSLPSKPVLLPLINIQRCHDNWNDQEDSDEDDCVASEEEMAWYTPVVGLSCSLVIFFWSCALAYYAKK